jgi:hypothetical protein
MKKRIYLVLGLSALIWGCASFTNCEKISTSGKGQPPVILDSFAVSEIRPGASWRVYIRAKDPDGDMIETIQIIIRGDSGPFKTAFSPLHAKYSAEMNGYFFLRTPPSTQADYTRLGNMGLTLRMSIRDCQNNESEHVEFPLRFTPKASHDLPPEWNEVADLSLGAVMFDLTTILTPTQQTN